jgi:hypothetical protein
MIILEICERNSSLEEKLVRISLEFSKGLEFLKQFRKLVTFFGSAILPSSHPACVEAYNLAYWAAKRGFTVMTGGGGSIMKAANKGARDAGGTSVGVLIRLPRLTTKEPRNKYVNKWMSCKYFFVRKFMLAAGDIYFFLPGAFGTMDELYEMATLVQTKKISPVPVILVDDKENGFWMQHLTFVTKVMVEEYGTLRKRDLAILHRVLKAKGAISYIESLIEKKIIVLPKNVQTAL